MPLSMVKKGEANIIKRVGGKEEVRKLKVKYPKDYYEELEY